MTRMTVGLLVVGMAAATAATGCKKDPPTTEAVPVQTAEAPLEGTPAAAPVPDAGVGETAAQGAADAGADPDLAIITITAVDIDTKLAVLCGLGDSQVFFKLDSAKLTPEAKDNLDKLATCATEGPAKGQPLQVVGRTDPTGPDAYNQKLGKSRAESVAEYLKKQGVKQARTHVESKGEAAALENAPSHWPLERRVTVRLQQ